MAKPEPTARHRRVPLPNHDFSLIYLWVAAIIAMVAIVWMCVAIS